MKLRNKKTGEIKEIFTPEATTLKEFCDIYEDYEEPKEYWYVSAYGNLAKTDVMTDLHRGAEEIGNLFDTQEEAEKALEKLKAWKRLKDAGVSFKPTTIGHKWYLEPHASPENRTFKESQDLYKDVMLFFGGEDDKK